MCLYLLAFFIPPIAVFMKRGCAADFWINVCLTICSYSSVHILISFLIVNYLAVGWIPGVIHAWWVIGKHDPSRYE